MVQIPLLAIKPKDFVPRFVPLKNLLESFIEKMNLVKKRSAVKTMRPLTGHFERSFDLFSEQIEHCHYDVDVCIYNMALIMNCVAYIEGEINQKLERLHTEKMFFTADYSAVLDNLPPKEKKKRFREKWNKTQSEKSSPNEWDDKNTVFLNFSDLMNLRNEIVHYKCDYLHAGELPNEGIERLIYQISDEQPYGTKPYHTQLYESWCAHLLKHKKLTKWCITTTKELKKLL